MGFRKRSFRIKILDKPWRVTFHSPEHYVKNVAQDSKAEIDDSLRTLDIDLTHLSHDVLTHELTHCYAKERSIVELNIVTVEQAEEFFCEINGKHIKTIDRQADTLLQWGRTLPWKKL